MRRTHRMDEIINLLKRETNGTVAELYSDEELEKFADDYDNGFALDAEEIIDAFIFDYCRKIGKECRQCSVCKNLMREGYCLNNGWSYYCSDKCLHTDFTDEEWKKECKEDDQTYYTEWY